MSPKHKAGEKSEEFDVLFDQFVERKFLYLTKNYLNIIVFASVQFAIN